MSILVTLTQNKGGSTSWNVNVESTLNLFHGQPACFEALAPGNNGDRLIKMGCREAITRAGLKISGSPDYTNVVVVSGSGGLSLGYWSHNLDALRNILARHRSVPVVVLPSTFYLKDLDFEQFFRERDAPVYLFAREPASLRVLQQYDYPSEVYAGLDHDMSFWLRDTEYVQSLKSRMRDLHILIVERFDNEISTKQPLLFAAPKKWRMILPPKWRKTFKERFVTKRLARTCFARTMLARVRAKHPRCKGMPVVAKDVSEPLVCSFEEFSTSIADAAIVITTRLHVGILAAMLGKETWIKSPAGPYKKITGIYEYSLAGLENVHLVD